jgi:cyclopropane-fatty-acyl-phospholipid synthase
VHRLEEQHDEALKYVDEATFRAWRLYLAGSAYGFRVGHLNLYQTLFVKPDDQGNSGLPLTRRAWYQD